MKNKNIKVYRQFDKEIEREWIRLWEISENASFFNSLGFFKACVSTFDVHKFLIVTYWKDNEMFALIPLIRRYRFLVNCLQFPGGRFMERPPILYKKYERDILKKFFRYIKNQGNLYFAELDIDMTSLILDSFNFAFATLLSENLYMDLTKENPLDVLSKKNFNRLKNKIVELQMYIDFRHIKRPSIKDLNKAFKIEGSSSKRISGKDIFSDRINRIFFENLIKYNLDSVVIDFITYKNRPFVYSIGAISKDIYHAYHTAFIADYKWIMPGRILLYYLIEFYKSERKKTLDFGRGHTSFKEEFSHGSNFRYDVYLTKNIHTLIWFRLINTLRRVRIRLLKSDLTNDSKNLFREYTYST